MKQLSLCVLFLATLIACFDAADTQVPLAPPPGRDSTRQGPISDSSSTEQPVKPMVEQPDYDTSEWAELIRLDTSILLDLKYATTDNFVGKQMYDCPRCFLRPEVARSIVRAQRQLQEGGLGLKMLDCYRPRPIQQKLWDKVPNASYVTPPSRGSMHNRGAAVDLTIVDEAGNELDMGTAYDFFGREAHQDYFELSEEVLANRRLLKSTMATVGLVHIRTEWWHYYYRKKKYELSDMIWACPGRVQKN